MVALIRDSSAAYRPTSLIELDRRLLGSNSRLGMQDRDERSMTSAYNEMLLMLVVMAGSKRSYRVLLVLLLVSPSPRTVSLTRCSNNTSSRVCFSVYSVRAEMMMKLLILPCAEKKTRKLV